CPSASPSASTHPHRSSSASPRSSSRACRTLWAPRAGTTSPRRTARSGSISSTSSGSRWTRTSSGWASGWEA
ncbi:MAG: hypothetical protein AVDCRST_MAG53-420, partial [uncultured Solirubrobacteraceae bacterium]